MQSTLNVYISLELMRLISWILPYSIEPSWGCFIYSSENALTFHTTKWGSCTNHGHFHYYKSEYLHKSTPSLLVTNSSLTTTAFVVTCPLIVNLGRAGTCYCERVELSMWTDPWKWICNDCWTFTALKYNEWCWLYCSRRVTRVGGIHCWSRQGSAENS